MSWRTKHHKVPPSTWGISHDLAVSIVRQREVTGTIPTVLTFLGKSTSEQQPLERLSQATLGSMENRMQHTAHNTWHFFPGSFQPEHGLSSLAVRTDCRACLLQVSHNRNCS